MNSKLLHEFGGRVRQERNRKAISQEQLAEDAGVHRTYIGMVERGEKNVTLASIKRIASALGVSLEYLTKGL